MLTTNIDGKNYYAKIKDLWKYDGLLNVFNNMDNIKVLYIDLFDVLILHTYYELSEMFFEVGCRGREIKILGPEMTPKDFEQLRILAEEKAKNQYIDGKYKTLSLEAIYENMPSNIKNISEWIELELQVMDECSYLNPSIVSLISYVRRHNVRVILLSNTYLFHKNIKRILFANNFPLESIDEIKVAYGQIKYNTTQEFYKDTLYQYRSVYDNSIIYIGNSKRLDTNKLKGIGIIDYTTTDSDINTIFGLERIRYGVFLKEILNLRQLSKKLINGYSEDEVPWVQIGATVLGPFLAAYIEWIVDICSRENKSVIYPLMREGELLTMLIQRAAEYRGIQLTVKPLYVSRLSTELAGIEKFNKEIADQYFFRRRLTVKDLLTLFDLQDAEEMFGKYLGVKLRDTVSVKFDYEYSLKEKLFEFLFERSIQNKINQVIDKHRKMLVQYLQQECDTFDNIVTVDLGFRGTIQRSLEVALSNSKIQHRITHILAIGTEQTKEKLFMGMDIRGFVGTSGENNDLIKTIYKDAGPIEELMMGDIGTTLGYEADDKGKINPILAVNNIPVEEIQMKKICQQGIINFQDLWFYFQDQKARLVEKIIKNKRDWCKMIHRLFDIPSYEEAVLLGGLHHDDAYGGNKAYTFCQDASAIIQEMGIEKFLQRTHYIHGYKNVFWPQAAVTKYEPGYFVRYYLKQQDDEKDLVIMCDVVLDIKKEGITSFVIYGAGEAGRYLLKAARLYDMDVHYIVDRKSTLWGQTIDGIKIISLEEAIEREQHIFAIGSFAFIKDIENNILAHYNFEKKSVQIFSAEI